MFKPLTENQKRVLTTYAQCGSSIETRKEIGLAAYTFTKHCEDIADKLGIGDPSESENWLAHAVAVAIATSQLDAIELASTVTAYNLPARG